VKCWVLVKYIVTFVVCAVVMILLLWIELFGCMIVRILVFRSICRLLVNGKNVFDVVIVLCVCLVLVCLMVSW